jgi:hypothetical protein
MAILTAFQRGAYFYLGIKLFNHLPINVKKLSIETKLFKLALKRVLLLHSFYLIEKYFNYNNKQNLGLMVIYITDIVTFIYYSYPGTILFKLILYK